jgi:hypothetical protein
MNFYTQQHKHYCGIDLPARALYVCILDQHGTKLVHKNLPTTPEAFLRVLTPYGSISYFLRLFCCDCSSTLCRYRSKTRSKVPLYLAHRSASI